MHGSDNEVLIANGIQRETADTWVLKKSSLIDRQTYENKNRPGSVRTVYMGGGLVVLLLDRHFGGNRSRGRFNGAYRKGRSRLYVFQG